MIKVACASVVAVGQAFFDSGEIEVVVEFASGRVAEALYSVLVLVNLIGAELGFWHDIRSHIVCLRLLEKIMDLRLGDDGLPELFILFDLVHNRLQLDFEQIQEKMVSLQLFLELGFGFWLDRRRWSYWQHLKNPLLTVRWIRELRRRLRNMRYNVGKVFKSTLLRNCKHLHGRQVIS